MVLQKFYETNCPRVLLNAYGVNEELCSEEGEQFALNGKYRNMSE